jgi:hypothetical protein
MILARRIIVSIGLLTYAALHGFGAFTAVAPFRYIEAVYSIGCMLGAFVLMRPTFWARRYVMGIGLAGLLNIAAYFGWFRQVGGFWFGIAQLAAFVAMFALLLGKKMRAFYDERAPHWKFDHPTMHVLAAALSLNVAGIAMLVHYACMDASWTTPGLRAGALCLSILLAIGTIASAKGKIVGLFLMSASAVASIGLGWSALELVMKPTFTAGYCGEWYSWMRWGQWETVKSIVGFAPAALGSLLCFGVFLGPMVRFVRNRTA